MFPAEMKNDLEVVDPVLDRSSHLPVDFRSGPQLASYRR
jgi:hypothetical protein